MNKDSDKNENRRDGDSSRSFGRRDDGRTSKPARSGDSRPRSNDTDRPRFGRSDSGAAPSRPRTDTNTDRPRFGRSDDRPRTDNDRPSFNRSDKPRPSGAAPAGRPDRPQRTERNRDERPARSPFGSRERSDTDRNRPDRERPSNPARPSFGRDRNESYPKRDDKPRFERNDRSSDKPRFERNDRPTDRSNDRPRFPRNDERPRSDRPTGSGSPAERRDDSSRKYSRSAGTGDAPRARPADRSDRRAGESRPRFSRDGDSPRRSDRSSAPKRVGGFSPEADDRNRENWSKPDGPDKHESRSQDSGSRNTRFTAEQRKDSGERRTGFFVKAPNYELEQRQMRKRTAGDEPRDARPRTDRSTAKGRPEARPARSEPADKPTRPLAGDPNTTRLNRYIANSGVCSRREADELITRGDISVNGKVITEMGFRVKEGDMVKYGTKALTPERFVYVLLNKPKDYLTTTEDPDERKTVMELVADAGNFRMYPVGRLDRKTTGLLLLTNDGELADKLTHPSNDVRKIYQVELDKPISEAHFDMLKKGIDLEDGPIKPDALSIVTPDAYVVGIEIHSGRNRIVRRMFESLGYDVTKLDRTAYAGLTKKELPRGKWRFLDPKEVVKLKYLS